MKVRFLFLAAAMLSVVSVAAQETYEDAKIATEDLNGTARYVGMGGALDALGADISTIGTNPAGIGLFRHSKMDISAGMVSQSDAADYPHGDATNASFDQVGFVWSTRSNESSFLNFAFNYHKSRNFNLILSADDVLSHKAAEGATVGASQNKLTWMKDYNGLLFRDSEPDGRPDYGSAYYSCNQLDDLYSRNLLFNNDYEVSFLEAQSYDFDRAHTGYIGEYDFNVSGNINDRVYLGMTLGLHDVHYKHISDYTELMVPNRDNINTLNVYDERKITGVGVDAKFGVIFRPVEYQPLLLGASISTPTYYSLTSRNYTELSDSYNTAYNTSSYDYQIYTPWKFGLSMGYTVGNFLALGASYEFADYGHINSRIEYDGFDAYDPYDDSVADSDMNQHTKQTLKGVSTLKLGVEVKPVPELALRAGYNYVSSMYEKDGFKDGTLQSPGVYYASTTDFTNWQSTNRLTLGIGYRVGKVNLDAAYQYSASKGDFYPFMSYEDNDYYDYDNKADAVAVNNKRHQLLFTVGYTF